MDEIVAADGERRPPLSLPIVAYYDTDRTVLQPHRRRSLERTSQRYQALQGALGARTDFKDFFNWFYAAENQELREQREERNFNRQLRELQAVRRAIESMVPGVSDPRTLMRPLRFVVTINHKGRGKEECSVQQLSGGYRVILALAADVARRMAQGNPHLDDPLASEAVVLIDEVDLHLHPSWQQSILDDLMRTFPNAQLIVSTHSP